jgi:parallel beta-helix repeat protein
LFLYSFAQADTTVPVCLNGASEWNDAHNLGEASTIFVPDNYTTIQAAVDAAIAGDTIMVRNGSYFENVKINTTVNLVGIDFPTIDGSFNPSMWGLPSIRVDASWVNISGFIIQHTPPSPRENDAGVWIIGNYCSLDRNVIHWNFYGIHIFYQSSNNTMSDNLIENNYDGIICEGSKHTIIGNTVSKNIGGILVSNCRTTLMNNTVAENGDRGIILQANETIMRNNTLKSNTYNFYFHENLPEQLINDIDTSNIVDGKPMYYWLNQCDKEIPSNAGYIAIINSSNITATNLDLRNNGQGVLIACSSNVTVYNCNFSKNWWGIYSWSSNNISIHDNNFISNYIQVETNSSNSWDDGYPSGGNYWSNYNGTDFYSGRYQNETGSDGITNVAYSIDVNNKDNYPLAAPISSFYVGNWSGIPSEIHAVSNSTISSFNLNETEKTIRFNVTGADYTLGFCRATIPKIVSQDMWQNNYTVLVDNHPPLEVRNWTDAENTYLYFSYQHSQHEITIVPEFPSLTLLLPVLTLAAVAVIMPKTRKKTLHYTMPNLCPQRNYRKTP